MRNLLKRIASDNDRNQLDPELDKNYYLECVLKFDDWMIFKC